MNVNQISEALGLPQSTIATNVQILEEAELIDTELVKASKGQQKICAARFDEIVIRLDARATSRKRNVIEVEMPLGLYTSYSVVRAVRALLDAGIIGVLDVPDLFLDPRRVQAALIWFGRGYVEYKFPNNAKVLNAEVEALEFLLELSSEVPGHQRQLAVGHQPLGQRRQGRHLDLAGGLRRPPRPLHAALVEARRLAVRRAHALARSPTNGTFVGRAEALAT